MGDETKPQHPAPWRWSGYNHERHYLIDGALNNVLFSRDKIEVASPRALALIAAAPEMEALLRHIATEVLPFEYGRPDGKEGGIAEAAQEIIARIDAAKAGE